jgi:hypothetical protein
MSCKNRKSLFPKLSRKEQKIMANKKIEEVPVKIVQVPVTKLKLPDYNPRRLSKKQEKDLTDSIKKFGFVDPIIINTHPDRNLIVVGGSQRVAVAKKLRIKIIPCVELNLSLDQERELNIRLNKNNGEFDEKLLKEHFNVSELINWGFTKKEIELNVPELIDRPKKPKPVRPNVEVLFQLGDVRFTLPQSKYVKWIDSIAHKVGLKKEVQVKEIQKRLGIKK